MGVNMKTVDHVRTRAHLTDEVTELEQRNREISREAAEEAIVLLENDGILPLKQGMSLALYGCGVTNTVKGGSGSGEVNERYSTSIYEGIKAEGFMIVNRDMLESYCKMAVSHRENYFKEQQKKAGFLNFTVTMANLKAPYTAPDFPKLSEQDLKEADVCIYVVSRISGESYDRKLEKGDYYLSDSESTNLRLCMKHYGKVILIINAGGQVDLREVSGCRFNAVIFSSMLGTDGGNAIAKVLSGKVNPSGHLTDTWIKNYEDIPGAMDYSYLNKNLEQEFYTEGIYVGYRYFDTKLVPVLYPFGYGKSYTSFQMNLTMFEGFEAGWGSLKAEVTNTGDREGKAVVQVYIKLPVGTFEKENRRLAGFAKTKLLAPEESETVSINFGFWDIASFSDEKNGYVAEKGDYGVYIGESIAVCRYAVLH